MKWDARPNRGILNIACKLTSTHAPDISTGGLVVTDCYILSFHKFTGKSSFAMVTSVSDVVHVWWSSEPSEHPCVNHRIEDQSCLILIKCRHAEEVLDGYSFVPPQVFQDYGTVKYQFDLTQFNGRSRRRSECGCRSRLWGGSRLSGGDLRGYRCSGR